MSPGPPPKISSKHDWKRELGSGPEGQIVQPPGSSQSNQPIPNPSREQSKRLDVTHDEIDVQQKKLYLQIDRGNPLWK